MLFLLLVLSSSIIAGTKTELTLIDAVDMAFDQNAQYQLSLWEKELADREEQLQQNVPTVTFSSQPVNIGNSDPLEDSVLKSPTGTIALDYPINDYTSLSGILGVEFNEIIPDVDSNAEISFTYHLFAPKQADPINAPDSDRALNNTLILDVVQSFIALAKQLDNLDYEEFNMNYLSELLLAAETTNNYSQTQQLKQQIRTNEQKISDLKMNIQQVNQELCYLLNVPNVNYHPVVALENYTLDYESEYLVELALNNSNERITAINNLTALEHQLTALQKSCGWNVDARAKMNWDFNIDEGPTWSIGLNASKTLYPQSLQLEKAELNVAQAQLHLAEVEQRITDQTLQRLQTMELLLENRNNIISKIEEEQEELMISHKHFEVGLVTELKLLEHQINLFSLNNDLTHNYYDYFSNLLQLYNRCGFDLMDTITEYIAREVG